MSTTKEFIIKITERGAKKVSASANKMEESFKKVGSAITAAIAVIGTSQVIRFGIEIAKLKATADGLRNSLQTLAHAEGMSAIALMEQLREATHGTVTEIELMRGATQAKYLGIDLKNLPTLFEFAARRAKDTGQNIDYLVNSIVTGIGRKSPLILDNLGIQMSDIDREIKSVAIDVGRWKGKMDALTRTLYFQEAAVRVANKGIKESTASFGDANDGVGNLTRSWETFKIMLANFLTGPAGSALKTLNDALAAIGISADKILAKGTEAELLKVRNRIAEIEAYMKRQNKVAEKSGGWWSDLAKKANDFMGTTEKVIKVTKDYTEELKNLQRRERGLSGQLQDEIDEAVWAKYVKEMGLITRDFGEALKGVKYEFGEIKTVAAPVLQDIIPYFGILRRATDELSQGIKQAFILQWEEGRSALKSFQNAFVATIEAMAAEILSRAAIWGLMSILFPGLGAGAALGASSFTGYIFGGFKAKGGPALPGHQYVMNEKSSGEVFVPNEPGRIEQQKNISLVIQTSDPKSFETWMRENDGGRMLQRLIAEA